MADSMDIKAAAVVKKERGDRCSGSSRDFFLNVKKSGENIHMQTWYSELNIYDTMFFKCKNSFSKEQD